MKKILFILLIAYQLFASNFTLNDAIPNFSLTDQFEKIHTVNENIKTIIVSFEKSTGAFINNFLAQKEADFLEKHDAVFIANISGMPSFITNMFALPKMKKYKHTILLIYDDDDERFIQKDDFSTVYKMENGKVKEVFYVQTQEELEKVF